MRAGIVTIPDLRTITAAKGYTQKSFVRCMASVSLRSVILVPCFRRVSVALAQSVSLQIRSSSIGLSKGLSGLRTILESQRDRAREQMHRQPRFQKRCQLRRRLSEMEDARKQKPELISRSEAVWSERS